MKQLTVLASLAAVALALAFAGQAQAAYVTISSGTPTNIHPMNNVLVPGGFSQSADGKIYVDGTLSFSTNVSIALFDVGSESGWTDQIRLGNTTGSTLTDLDDYSSGSGIHSPWQSVGSVTQNAGVADVEFWKKINSSNYKFLVENGHSPNAVLFYGDASIAFAYLDGKTIVNTAVLRNGAYDILVLLDDSGAGPDDNHDDYVGVLRITPQVVPLPAAAWLLLSGLAGLAVISRRRKVAA